MSTFWLVPVLLRVVVANIFGAGINKMISGDRARSERLSLGYFFAACLASGVALFLGQFSFDGVFLLALGIGFVNGFGAYCQLRANNISLSKSSLFTWGDDVIALALSYFILAEVVFITSSIGFGIAASFLAVFLFSLRSYRLSRRIAGEKREIPKHESATIFLWVGAYSVIWGITTFLIRYLAVADIGVGKFIHGWYWGAFLASLVILLGKYQARGGELDRLTPRDVFLSLAFAVIIMTALGLHYFAFALAPLVVVQPIFLVSEMVLPVLLGLFGFRERKMMDREGWLYFFLAIAGSLAIIGGFLNL